MEAYGYFLAFILFVAKFAGVFLILATTYWGLAELANAIKYRRVSWSHIPAAGILVAGYVVRVFRKQPKGRHSQDGTLVFWSDMRTEFESTAYSLCRANAAPHGIHAA